MTMIEELEGYVLSWRVDGEVNSFECADQLEHVIQKWRDRGIVVTDEALLDGCLIALQAANLNQPT